MVSLVWFSCTPSVESTSSNSGGASGANLKVTVSPAFGTTTGGQRISISGLSISELPTILIGGVACTKAEFDARDLISCETPAGTLGEKDIEIKLKGTRYYMIRSGFDYLDPLALESITPAIGRADGGTRVTITGKGFGPGASVMIGSGGCTDVSLNNAASLTCTAPEKNGVGSFSVTVTNVNGDKAILESAYTVFAPPLVTSVSPSQGPVAGGTAVEVIGSGMHEGVTVLIGSSVCGSMTVDSEYKVSCTTAAGSSGTKTVTVVDGSGQQGSLASGFTFVASPLVAQIVPSSGSIAGGDIVTVIGNNFVNGAVVRFDTSVCTSTTFSAADTLTCVVPAHAAGNVTVTVTNPDGQVGQLNAGYSYNAISAPNVTAISPTFGAIAGATAVTITGTNFANGATVTIGGTNCNGTTFVSSKSITCTTPAGEAGVQDVVVTNPNALSGTLTEGFTYSVTSNPVITSVSPNFGSLAGGTVVVIRGSSFQTGVKVTIDGIACASLTRLSSSELSCITPVGTIGAKSIGVRNPNGTSTVGTGNNVFNYTNGFPPSISFVDPNSGPSAGGTPLTIRGANFVAGATVLIGGTVTVTCLDTTFVNATTLTCTTPPGNFGQRSINVVNPDGQTGAALANAFAYNTPYTPTVTSAAPNWGPISGNTLITVNGSNFQTGAIAQIGTAAGNLANCMTTTVLSATQLTCLTPPGTYGAKIINVINPDGSFGSGASGVFSYSNGQRPTVTFVTPNTGPVIGGTSVTVLGSNFMQGSLVQFSATNMNTINCPTTFVSATTLTCVTPPGAYGSFSVNVLNPDGGTMTTPVANAFAYFLGYAPIISSVSPSTGWVGGETKLSVIGSGFDASNPSPLITLRSSSNVFASCTNPQIVSSSLATCTVPAASAGAVTLTLYNADSQSASASNAFTYNVTRSFQNVLHGPDDNMEFGSTIVSLGNIDGVTGPEFAVAAPSATGSTPHSGKVFIYTAANMSTPLCTISSPSPQPEGLFGYSMSAVNLSGAAGGIVIGEPGGGTSGAGRAYVYNLTSACQAAAALSNGAELLATLSGSNSPNASFGFSVTAGKIMTTALGAPNWDVVVGEPNSPGATTPELGAVYMFDGNTGPFNSVATLNTGSLTPGAASYDHVGFSVLAIDLDNDTYAEVAIGAPGYGTVAAPNAGGVYILKGRTALDWLIANRYYTVASGAPIQPVTTANWRTGSTLAVAGRVTDDRRLDLLVGSPGGGSASTGAFYVYSIPTTTSTSITSGFFTVTGSAGEQWGRGIAGIGDYNGDGRDDFVVTGPMNTTGRGRFLVYSGQEAATGFAFNPLPPYTGTELNSALGRAVSSLGDINSDGRDDFLIGEPWANAGGPRRGRVFVVLGM
jgi:hypothetical protein